MVHIRSPEVVTQHKIKIYPIKFLSTVKNSVWRENAAKVLYYLLQTFSSFTVQTQTRHQCIKGAETVHMYMYIVSCSKKLSQSKVQSSRRKFVAYEA